MCQHNRKENSDRWKLSAGIILRLPAVLLVLLCLTGCTLGSSSPEASAPAAETVPVTQTEAPTEPQPTEETRKEYPKTVTAGILVEGEPQELPMDLFDAGSYVIYIPRDTWSLETYMEGSLLVDHWSCQWAPEVWLKVVSFGPMTIPEAAEALGSAGYTLELMEENEYHLVGSPNTYGGVEFFTDGKNTFAALTEMPYEFGDGFAPRFRAMTASFEIR